MCRFPGKEHFTKLEQTVSALSGMDAVIAEKFGEPVRGLLNKHQICYLETKNSVPSSLIEMENIRATAASSRYEFGDAFIFIDIADSNDILHEIFHIINVRNQQNLVKLILQFR